VGGVTGQGDPVLEHLQGLQEDAAHEMSLHLYRRDEQLRATYTEYKLFSE
jgi:hypothetical protein